LNLYKKNSLNIAGRFNYSTLMNTTETISQILHSFSFK